MLRRSLRLAIALALLPATLLTLARVWQPAPGPLDAVAVQVVPLVPIALLGYAAAGAAALVLARSSRRALLAAAVAVLGLGLHLWWFAPQLTADARPAATTGPRLRVMTLNAQYGSGNGAEVAALARSSEADVVVVEEATPPLVRDALAAGLDADFPHRVGTPRGGPGGTVVWSRLPVRLQDRLPTRFDSLRFTVVVGGREVELVGVHPATPLSPSLWRAEHRTLLAVVRAEGPDLVLGDFNATPDHAVMRAYAEEGYRSSADLTGAAWAPTWPSNRESRHVRLLPRFAQIDQVLLGPGWTALSSARLRIPGSDHTAVLAEVAVAAGAAE